MKPHPTKSKPRISKHKAECNRRICDVKGCQFPPNCMECLAPKKPKPSPRQPGKGGVPPVLSRKHTIVLDESTANKHGITLEQAKEIIAHEQAANASLRYRLQKAKFVLAFYAGMRRRDGNGYEFDPEPSGIKGALARAVLASLGDTPAEGRGK